MSDERTGASEGLDAYAFEALVVEHAASLHRFARTLTSDVFVAEDLVQETFVRAFAARGTFRGEATQRTWLHRILLNLAIDRGRRSEREVLVDEVEDKWRDEGYTVDAALVVERAETRAELQDALVRLPFIYRSAVILHDVEGWTAREIAEAHEIELPAAKQRLRRGRMMLVSALAAGAERGEALHGVPLRCWDARSRVSAYLDGELEDEERALVRAHLGTCPTCPPLYAALVGVRERLAGMRDPDTVIPPGLARRIGEPRERQRDVGTRSQRYP